MPKAVRHSDVRDIHTTGPSGILTHHSQTCYRQTIATSNEDYFNIMVALSLNYTLQDHLIVSSDTITNQPTLHDSKCAGEDAHVR